MKQHVDPDNVILQYQDNQGIVHEISLNNLLDGGTPLNEDESEMELLDTFLLKL